MFHYMAVDDAVLLSRGYGKEIQLGLDPLTRLSMHERHRRRICRPHVSWSLAPYRCCSDSVLRGREFYTFTRSHARGQNTTYHTPTSIRDVSVVYVSF